ncbi:angiotensin-converting enzyme-like isoform X2 [Ptychodera flava]
MIYAESELESFRNASMFDIESFSEETQRQFKLMMNLGDAALQDQEKLKRLQEVKAQMVRSYATTQVCNISSQDPDECHTINEGIPQMFATSRNYNELTQLWTQWHNMAGQPIREQYSEFVQLSNMAARANGFTDTGALWRWKYEVEDFEEQVLEIYDTLKPLYFNLHAYVRRKLIDVYGSEYVNPKGAIPAHLLGNMWAQQWHHILNLTEPFPGKHLVDVTPILQAKGYTPRQMFEEAEAFFTNLGLIELPQEFWDRSMIEKPTDGRQVDCHPSAFDFLKGNDVRMKMCTRITMEHFITIHHELGHIQYYLQYSNQSFIYNGGANPGFHEAVGDVLALSVATPEHLHMIGLYDDDVDNPEGELNFLMKMALEKIAFLPFGLLVDLWRWRVFSGDITPDNYNTEWWDLRMKYQGVVPPVDRPEEYFDPGAKHHIPSNTPYMRYFVSFVIQFQFHRALCLEAGQLDNGKPLHKCDIHKSKQAGEKLSAMLKLGKSKPWPDAMEAITGQRKMDAGALIEYFQPLIDWLERENVNNGDVLGWDPTWRPPPPSYVRSERDKSATYTGKPVAMTTSGGHAQISSAAVMWICICLLTTWFSDEN